MNCIRPHPGQHAVSSLYDVQHGLVVHQTRDDDIGGGGSSLGASNVAHAAPDGYTVLLGGTLPHVNEALLKSKPVGLVAEREKMPFEVTPFMPYLTRFNPADTSKPVNASATDGKPPESANASPDGSAKP